MRTQLKQLIIRILPFPLHFYVTRRERRQLEAEMRQHRQAIVNFPLTGSGYLQAYWKIYGIGRGPALILYIEHEPVLKFDFYGAGKAHYHIQSLQPSACRYPALMMRESSVPEQIDRALFELENNLYWYLERHPLAAVRQFRCPKEKLKEALAAVKPLLLSYIEQVPSEAAVS